MKVFFRADANQVISAGHVVRCLSLADSFRAVGCEVVFASSDGIPSTMIAEAGFEHVVLGGDWRDLNSDDDALRRLVIGERDSLLLVDSYSIDRRFVERMSSCSTVCYLGSKPGYLGPLAALINYSTAIDYDAYETTYKNSGTVLLLGPRYAPLRKQFQGLEPIRIAPRVRRVLISTGGTDPFGMSLLVTESVLSLADEYALEEIVVLVGSMSSSRLALEERFIDDQRVRLVSGVSDMAGLMQSCDLAVSANGTTVYELAACGLPAITFAMVEEQRASGEGMFDLGAVAYCGCVEDGMEDCLNGIVSSIKACCGSIDNRLSLQKRANIMTDGNGALRIVNELGKMRLISR